MRDAFADELLNLAREDARIVLLSGDIGNRMFDKFKAEFPDRFFNCGVAEANMITTAAGMAMTGLIPVVYTIASFLVYRPLEQIRVDIAYHGLPVILVGVGGGLAYASNGPTHHAVEDMAVMRSVPGMTLVSVGDAHEVRGALRQLIDAGQPAYLRIGKKREPLVYKELPADWKIGKAQPIIKTPNAKIALLIQGSLLPEVKNAATLLSEQGVEMNVFHFHTLRPLDKDGLGEICKNNTTIYTLEEHSINGALGSAVAEYLAENMNSVSPIHFHRIGLPDRFLKRTTNTTDAREQCGLLATLIRDRILKDLNK